MTHTDLVKNVAFLRGLTQKELFALWVGLLTQPHTAAGGYISTTRSAWDAS